MRRAVVWLLLLAGLVVALLWVPVWLFQDRLIWFPGPPPSSDPSDRGLAFQPVALRTPDGLALDAWWIEPAEGEGAAAEREPTAVLFCHGNAGNIEGRLPAAAVLAQAGHGVLLFDYRGYGRSEGEPDEEGTYVDAVTAFDRLTAPPFGFAPGRIALWGESLGGAVAVELAGRRPAGALVLESAFTSIADVGAHHYPWLPVRWLARTRYDNLAKIGALELPLLVIHSPADEIVPFSHGERLFAAAREPKAWLATEAGHNDGGALPRPMYRVRALAFLQQVFAGE